MWRKTEDSKPRTLRDAAPPAVSSVPHPVAAMSAEPHVVPAAVSQGIKIKGEVSGQGDLSVDGEFEGKIQLDRGTFTVGRNARVSAEITAREVLIHGEVRGTLKACERVHIWSTGKLTGDMETRGIVIEDGAVLHSKVVVPQSAAVEVAAPQVSIGETQGPSGQASLSRGKGVGA